MKVEKVTVTLTEEELQILISGIELYQEDLTYDESEMSKDEFDDYQNRVDELCSNLYKIDRIFYKERKDETNAKN